MFGKKCYLFYVHMQKDARNNGQFFFPEPRTIFNCLNVEVPSNVVAYVRKQTDVIFAFLFEIALYELHTNAYDFAWSSRILPLPSMV